MNLSELIMSGSVGWQLLVYAGKDKKIALHFWPVGKIMRRRKMIFSSSASTFPSFLRSFCVRMLRSRLTLEGEVLTEPP